MNRNYEKGMMPMENAEFSEAAELFAKSFREGYQRRLSLLYYSNSKFMHASLDFNGTGIIRGLPRRSLLISASTALKDGLKEFGEDEEYLIMACYVEYALGLLLTTKNGLTMAYYEYLARLRCADFEMLDTVYEFLPNIDSAYS